MRLIGTTRATSRPACSLTWCVTARGHRQEVGERPAVQHEQHQHFRVGAGRAAAGRRHLAELEARGLLRDRLDVVREVVLAVDEDDFLGAAGDHEIAVVQEAEVAGAQPPVGAERGRRRLGRAEVAGGDAVAAQLDVTDGALGHRAVVIVREAQLDVRQRPADMHQRERGGIACRGFPHRFAHAQLVAIDAERCDSGCRASTR